jgi:hypothetical protein
MEHKLNLLQESARGGHLRFSINASRLVDSLIELKSTPNGRYDLTTVDELIRPALLMTKFKSEPSSSR